MRIVAVSGGTGTGKSTVLEILENRGYGVIDTDRIAHEILRGAGDIGDIRRRFFTDPEFRSAHSKWIRPRIYRGVIREVVSLALQGHSVVFIEIPLLFELGLNPYLYTMVVTCDRDVQMERARDVEYLDERLRLQLPMEDKVRMAQVVIHNNGTLDELRNRIDRLSFGGCSIYCCMMLLLAVLAVATAE